MIAEHVSNLLIAEDDPQSAHLLSDLLTSAGYACRVATDGDTTLQLARKLLPDLILLDVRIPGRNGFEVCERLKSDALTAHIPVVMVTAFTEEQIRLRAMDAGADDFLTKPVKRTELFTRVRSLLRIRRCMAERETPEAVVQSLFTLITLHDGELARHSQAVSTLAGATARNMGLAPGDARLVEQAGLLHDLGKVVSVDRHAERGEQILSGLGPLSRLAPLLRGHHERWNGEGSPDGLKGPDQPACMQILAAVNQCGHLLSEADTYNEALAAWQRQAAHGWFNPALFEPLARAVHELYAHPGAPNCGF